MTKPNLLVLSPTDHYALRNLEAIKDAAHIFITNDEKEAREFARTADVILYSGLAGKTVSFPEVFAVAGQVKWIHSLSAGVEKLLFPALAESTVPLTNARGVFKRSLAEFVVLGILYFAKRVRRLVDNQRASRWDNFSTEFINNKVMGIVGYGEIGRECALLAKPLGVKIYAARRNPERSANDPLLDRIYPSDKMNEMLGEIDVLVAAAPLTAETHHLISDSAFNALKPSAIAMNVGRGPVIDEAALVRALQAKQIAGAALDVFEVEPLPSHSPLWGMENVLISPHCTDRTVNPDWLDLSMQCFVANFWRFVKDQPLENVVDKKGGY
jgi:phosphoglycerate dehydrogenase-like enzyme